MTPKIPRDLTCLNGCRLHEVLAQNSSLRSQTDCGEESEGYFNCYLNQRIRNSRLLRPKRKDDCEQKAHEERKGVCHYMANTYKDLIFDICYIATCFGDAARISKLYKGLSCTEISVETG